MPHKSCVRLFPLLASLFITIFTLQTASAADPLQVGFLYVSPVGDAGFTRQIDTGRKEMEKNLGAKVSSHFLENVPEGPAAEKAITDLVKKGDKLIVTASFGYMEPTMKIAAQYPDVKFIHLTGYKNAANVSNANARFYEGRYLAGILAGKMSKSGVAGYVAAFPIPEVIQGINAFARGMSSVNPKAEIRVLWVNSWYDPVKEKAAALDLAKQGADVLTQHTDSTAVVQAAEEKGIYAIAYHSDMKKYGPKAQLAAVTHHWGNFFTREAQNVIDGKWKSDSVYGGIKDGMIKLEFISPTVPKEVKQLLVDKEAELVAGSLTPFVGPMKDNTGKMRLEKGPIGDFNLKRMYYLVEGVVGTVPAQQN